MTEILGRNWRKEIYQNSTGKETENESAIVVKKITFLMPNKTMAPLHVATLTVKRELPKYEMYQILSC